MTTTSSSVSAGPSLRAMARIEAKRFARNPVFLIGVLLAFGVFVAFVAMGDGPASDLLSWPVIPAFFIGLTSLVVAARQTRSTEAAAEAMGAAPGTEARRTLALAIACLVPFVAGLVFLAASLVVAEIRGTYSQEWWFHSAPDAHVLAILVALGPVACLGGGLLGVLVGRWLRFPGAAAVAVLVTVIGTRLGQFPGYGDNPELRLWTPWAMFHSATFPDGTQVLFAGSAVFYLFYLLCLCAAAVLVAVWHDPTARTGRTRAAFAGVVVVGLSCLALAMTTGIEENRVSDPIPAKVEV